MLSRAQVKPTCGSGVQFCTKGRGRGGYQGRTSRCSDARVASGATALCRPQAVEHLSGQQALQLLPLPRLPQLVGVQAQQEGGASVAQRSASVSGRLESHAQRCNEAQQVAAGSSQHARQLSAHFTLKAATARCCAYCRQLAKPGPLLLLCLLLLLLPLLRAMRYTVGLLEAPATGRLPHKLAPVLVGRHAKTR